MQYILTENPSFNRDILFLFPDIEIKDYLKSPYRETECACLAEVDWNNTRLLICDAKKNCAKYEAITEKLEEETQYIWAEVFLSQLDSDFEKYETWMDNLIGKRKLAIWGVGNTWNDFKKIFAREPEIFIDSNEKKDEKVVKPEEIQDWSELFVIITSRFYDEISEELKKKGLEESQDYVSCFSFWGQIPLKPSKVVMDMQEAKKYEDILCRDPFSVFKVIHNGGVYPCICESWIRSAGNILEQSYDEIVHGIDYKLIQLSVINRTYYFCDKREGQCAYFDKTIYPNGVIMGRDDRNLKDTSKQVFIAFDKTCNLKCPSCRKDFIMEDETPHVESVRQAIEEKLLPEVEGAVMASAGEFFFSRQYKKLVASDGFKNVKKLLIITNGILCNEENWKELRQHYKGEVQLLVSIDAASEEVYRTIRKGSFQKLLEAMEYMKQLRRSGEISYWGINYVIQQGNMSEIDKFIELGKRFEVDSIYFGCLRNWGTFEEEEFQDRDVFLTGTRQPGDVLAKIVAENQNDREQIVNWFDINGNFEIRGFYDNEW